MPVRAVPSHMLGLGVVAPHHAPPFELHAPAPAPLHTLAPVAPVAVPPRYVPMGAPTGQTAFASNSASDLKTTLPFAAGAGAPPAGRGPTPAMPRLQVGSGTRMADAAPAKPALPFQGDPAVEGEWTIERHAAICIALVAPGRERAEVLAEHRCTEPLLVSLNTHWKGVMGRDTDVHRRWKDVWRRARG